MSNNIWRFNLKNDEIVKTNGARSKINLNDYTNSLKVDVDKLHKGKFSYKKRIFKIIQILNDTKHDKNKQESVISEMLLLTRWDNHIDTEFDFAILVYNAGNRYLNILVSKDAMLKQGKREANYFFTMNDLKYLNSLKNFKQIKIKEVRVNDRFATGVAFSTDKFSKLF